MFSTQSSQKYSCRINIPTQTGLWKWFSVRSTQLAISSNGLDIDNQHIKWTDIQRISRKRGKLSITTENSFSEFLILSPITGLQDTDLASLIERLSIALFKNDREQANKNFKELRIFSNLARFSMLISVIVVLIGGTLIYFFPKGLFELIFIAGGLSLGIAWLPMFYAKWKQKNEPPI